MKIFRDSRDREWEINVNVPDVERVKAGCGLDLYDLGKDGPIFTLGENFAMTLNVLWLLLKPQIQEREGLSEEEFYNQLNGDDIVGAADVIQDAMEEWLPEKKRAMFAKALRFQRQLRETAMETFVKKMGNPDLQQQVDEQLRKQLDEAFEKLQGSMSDALSLNSQE